MKEEHLSEETIRRLRAGELSSAGVVEAFRHIAACDGCAALARGAAEADAVRLRDTLAADAAEPPRHLTQEELFGWTRGTLDAVERDAAAAHLAECALCREDTADLQQLRGHDRRWVWLAAAAAVAVIALAATLFTRDRTTPPHIVRTPPPVSAPPQPRPEPPPRPRYANADWTRLVEDALSSGRLPQSRSFGLPDRDDDTIRGTSNDRSARLAPAGVVIEDTRPELTWPRVAGATYTVSIFDGDEEVLHSEPLRIERWTPPRALPRGRTYTWQVEAKGEGFSDILPAPPAPPAMFHILGAREHADLTTAREQYPDDPLLLAALYARNGMLEEAREHLRRLESSTDPRVQRLRANFLRPAAR